MALTGVSYQTSIVARNRADTLYGADSGAEYALQQVRQAPPSPCSATPSTFTLPKPSASPITADGTITCTGGDPGSPGSPGSTGSGYAAIATGTSGVTVGGTIGATTTCT